MLGRMTSKSNKEYWSIIGIGLPSITQVFLMMFIEDENIKLHVSA